MNQFKHAMITRSTVISFETAAKVVGKDELIQFVRRGIVKRIRRSNRFSPTYLDSLPQNFHSNIPHAPYAREDNRDGF